MTDKPEYYEIEEFQNRLKKLKEIKDFKVNPFPYSYSPTHTPKDIHEEFSQKEIGSFDEAQEGKTKEIITAGRLVLFRPMGKNAFGQLQDETGRIQFMCNRDITKVEGFSPTSELSNIKFIEKKIDLGDIIGIKGNIFRTQKGEITIFVKSLILLSKSLLPLPDKHSGLADKEMRYRKRWLDLIANKNVQDTFILRSKIIKIIRQYMDEAGFLEVETPVLQSLYGGANAKPFKTHLNALHQDMFLRISLEIPLKKLLVGGLLKVYELGKVFRNEGLDRTHNPEFTEIEGYAAYWDYNKMMSFIENLFENVALKLFGDTKVRFARENESESVVLDFKSPWKRLTMKESIKEYADIDIDSLSDDDMRNILLEKTKISPKEIKKATRGTMISFIFEEFAEHHLIQPHHITDHPIETTPLCKSLRDPKNHKEHLVERFESFALGSEIVNAYSELNDPIFQRELFEQQQQNKKEGDEEAHPLDEEFLEAMCQGMPTASGFGAGIDRIVMLFTSASSIRDVIYFPMMRKEEN